MDRVLSCECGKEHYVSNSQAGQEIQCSCGKIIPVPTLRRLRDLPLAQAATVQPAATATRGELSKRQWQGWRGVTLAVTMAGFLVATIACGWFSLQRWSIDTSYTVAQELVAGDVMIDSFDPNTLSTMWHNFGQMDMRRKHYPEFYLYQLYAAERTRLAQITGAIAAGFAAIGLVIWLTTPKQSIPE